MVSYSFLESESSSSYHDWNMSPMQFLDRIKRKNKKINLIYSEKKDETIHNSFWYKDFIDRMA